MSRMKEPRRSGARFIPFRRVLRCPPQSQIWNLRAALRLCVYESVVASVTLRLLAKVRLYTWGTLVLGKD
jgi:hypothetical protein